MKALILGAFLASIAVPAFAATVAEAEAFCNDARLKRLEQKDCHAEIRAAKTDKERQRIIRSYHWVLTNTTPLRNDPNSDEAGVRGATASSRVK